MRNVIFVSATPGDYELEHSKSPVEQIIRPTGLLDPEVEVRPIDGQVKDVMTEISSDLERGSSTGYHPHQTAGRGVDRLSEPE